MTHRWTTWLVLALLTVALAAGCAHLGTVYLPMLNNAESTRWQPGLHDTWQWQLTGTVDTSFDTGTGNWVSALAVQAG